MGDPAHPQLRCDKQLLTGVSCTAATACTAVGYYVDSHGTANDVGGALERHQLGDPAHPQPRDRQPLRRVVHRAHRLHRRRLDSYSSGAAVTLAERWNGSSWRIQPTPNPPARHSAI